MIDGIVSFLVVVGYGCMAGFTGYCIGRIHRKKKVPKAVEPLCGCGDHASYHDEQGCHFLNRYMTQEGTVTDIYEMVRCPCRKYTGPVPLESIYAPEITP